MTTTAEPSQAGAAPAGPIPIVARPFPPRSTTKGAALTYYLRTTDPKVIGRMYLVTSLAFFALGGVMALLMRIELARPGRQLLSQEQYNQLFTMHGTIMLLFFATPILFAFANLVLPLQIGAPDVAFPRLNAFSYWLYLFGAITATSGFFTPNGAADFGWYAYSPLTNAVNSPGAGADLWILGLAISGLGTILGGVNMVTTVITLRAPGMTMFRMPIFTWNILVTSLLILLAFPILTAALLVLYVDRHMGSQVFEANNGGSILWQHLFWFFGHPEVYIVALPFFGIVTEIIPVFSRKPLFGYKGMVLATLSIAALSLTVWAHHMFTTGAVLLPFFSVMTFLIAVPTGIKFFNWIGSMWGGAVTFESPMLFSVGFLVTFLFGGLTGVLLASPPIDFHVADSYFVIAHFHYVLFGTIVFAVYAGIYFWFPKFTGRYLDERLGKFHFWLTFIGFHMTFLVQHWLGAEGMPRRYVDYLPTDGFTGLNTFSTIGSFVLGASLLPFLYNVYKSYKYGEICTADDPWGHGNSLEWATSSPPPRHNFTSIPRIRSERPAFEAHYPHLLDRLEAEAHAGRHSKPAAGAVQRSGRSEGPDPRRLSRPVPLLMQPTSVLATLTGRDRPGVVASFFAALAAYDVDVQDVEQVVIRDRLILAVLLDLRGEPGPLRNSVTKAAHALGMECEVAVADEGGGLSGPKRYERASRSHVIVMGRPLRPGALSHVAQCIADVDANIESVTQLSVEPASSIELTVRSNEPARLRASLVRAAEDTGLDIAVEPAGLRRRAKRLVVMDVDSTLIQDEAIDVLAAHAGVGEQVATITERAMAGELDFAESLRARVSLLAGLTVADLDTVRDALRLTPGARTFVRTLRRLGFHVGVVSGGFTFVTDHFVRELGLDFAAANELEIVDGVLTGRVVGDIVDRAGKAAALARFAESFGVPVSQTVAVGDGANDIDMLEAAGLGVAFNAKAALRRAADTSVNLPYLDTVLFLLGISDEDVAEAAAD